MVAPGRAAPPVGGCYAACMPEWLQCSTALRSHTCTHVRLTAHPCRAAQVVHTTKTQPALSPAHLPQLRSSDLPASCSCWPKMCSAAAASSCAGAECARAGASTPSTAPACPDRSHISGSEPQLPLPEAGPEPRRPGRSAIQRTLCRVPGHEHWPCAQKLQWKPRQIKLSKASRGEQRLSLS